MAPRTASAVDEGRRFDIAVVGGGLVGAACALCAAAHGARVAVVEARDASFPDSDRGFDLRVVALSLGSCRFLERLGVWQRMRSERSAPFRDMRVWDGAGPRVGRIHFAAADLGVPALGKIVENWVVLEGLERAMADAPGVELIRPARVQGIRVSGDSVTLLLDGAPVEASLLVGADGSSSAVRTMAGIGASERDYGQRAVVATVRTEHHHEFTAWQRFLDHGPIALLPLPDGFGSVVWSTRPEHAEQLVEGSPESFAHAFELALERRLGAVRWASDRASFPLRRVSAAAYVGNRIALVGDAAHTIHPLAGQGVNLGLMDAASLGELAGAALRRSGDPGRSGTLRRYAGWRSAHNGAVGTAMDALHTLFTSDLGAARVARGLGLAATGRSTRLKRAIMGLAMGVEGDLPADFRALPELGG